MNKKILSIFILLLLVFLGGCVTTTTQTTDNSNVTLPDLSGKTRTEITTELEDLGLTVKYYFDNSKVYTDDSQYDQFQMYGSSLVSGDTVAAGSEVKVYTSPLNVSLNYTYKLSEYKDSTGTSLQLQSSDFEGKEFIADGIGEVSVFKFVDGDTTFFDSNGESFSVRYLGIDTPESTALYEPWGKAAAKYTAEKLGNAEKIVLQAEGERKDGNGRYLAWVWYLPKGEDTFYLLNLELVELAYSKNKVSTGSKYTQILTSADWDASLTKRRVWGEIDPNYDYSKEGVQMSIEYLMNNFKDYVGQKVVLTAVVTRKVGNSVYLQDQTGYGIYLYILNNPSSQLQVGAHVSIGGLVPGLYSGAPQVSNFNKLYLTLSDDDTVITAKVITYQEFESNLIGTLITMEHLTVQKIVSDNIYVKDSFGNSFIVRNNNSTVVDLSSLGITTGSVITVTGPLGYYDYNYNNDPETYVFSQGNYQLLLTTSDDIVIE